MAREKRAGERNSYRGDQEGGRGQLSGLGEVTQTRTGVSSLQHLAGVSDLSVSRRTCCLQLLLSTLGSPGPDTSLCLICLMTDVQECPSCLGPFVGRNSLLENISATVFSPQFLQCSSLQTSISGYSLSE